MGAVLVAAVSYQRYHCTRWKAFSIQHSAFSQKNSNWQIAIGQRNRAAGDFCSRSQHYEVL
jgi:hypothetical protein